MPANVPDPFERAETRTRWRDAGATLRICATTTLQARPQAASDDGGLWMLAMAGEEPLFIADSRPFTKGRHDGPIIELGCLAVALGADRVAVGQTARVWSMDDPIPPVSGEVDMRQRALMVVAVDGHGRADPTVSTPLFPFALVDGEVRWEAQANLGDTPAEGWVADALHLLIRQRHEIAPAPLDLQLVQDQFERCLRLGHEVGLTSAAIERLQLLELLAERAATR